MSFILMIVFDLNPYSAGVDFNAAYW